MKTLYKIRREDDGYHLDYDRYYLDGEGFSKDGIYFSQEEIDLGLKYYTLTNTRLTLIKYEGDKKYEYPINKDILKILNRDNIIDEIINI